MTKRKKTMNLLILSPVMIEGEMMEKDDEALDVPMQDAKGLIYRDKAIPLPVVEEPEDLNDLNKADLIKLAEDVYDLNVDGLKKAEIIEMIEEAKEEQ